MLAVGRWAQLPATLTVLEHLRCFPTLLLLLLVHLWALFLSRIGQIT